MSKDHYNKLSSNFEKNWFFSETYIPSMLALISKHLKFNEGDHFIDLGCGTGNYTSQLVQNSKETPRCITGVDFSNAMIEQFNKTLPEAEGHCSGLEEFVSKKTQAYDKILLKEVIHHVKNPISFYTNLKKIVNKPGAILIVTRPQHIEFPFFPQALKYFHDHQVPLLSIESKLNEVGFKVATHFEDISISIGKDRLLSMIKNRFMSTFDAFNDQELIQGLKWLENKYEQDEILNFKDKLIFISAQI